MSELAEWDSFYVILGSAAGALIGLQFVVTTLIAQRPRVRGPEMAPAFLTPTIVHFGAAWLSSDPVVRARRRGESAIRPAASAAGPPRRRTPRPACRSRRARRPSRSSRRRSARPG